MNDVGALEAGSARVFRELFETYPDGVFLVDQNGRIVLANHCAGEQFGYPPQWSKRSDSRKVTKSKSMSLAHGRSRSRGAQSCVSCWRN